MPSNRRRATPCLLQVCCLSFATDSLRTSSMRGIRGRCRTSPRRHSSPRSPARSSPSGRTRASTSGTPARPRRSSRRRSSAGCATSSGFGEGSFGLLTSGGVMANFIGMALARDVHVPRITGASEPPRGRALEGLRVYTSDQTHFSVGRALDELGFPPETLVVLPSDDRFRLHAQPVADAISADRASGLTPIAIAAVAGSTNTGSVDLVPELAELARHEDLWLHVDAAYGGAARLSERDAARVPGLELADSVTLDPHKWFFQAYDIGGLLVRDGSLLGATFGRRRPEYYRGADGQGTAPPRRRPPRRRPRRPAQLLQARVRGHASLAGAEAVAELEAPRHDRVRQARRTDRSISRRRSRSASPSATTSRRCPRSPSCRSCASATCPAVASGRWHWIRSRWTATRTPSRRSSRRPAMAGCRRRSCAGLTYLRAGIVNYLTTEADLDRILDRLRELARA